MKEPIPYGECTRTDGTKFPVYFLYEIEEGKAQVNIPGTEIFLDINESYEALGGRKANHPNRPLFQCTEFTRAKA